MIDVTDKAQCTGCTACASVCPHAAITMIADEEGFSYPRVSMDQCTGCGRCEDVCPVHKPAVHAPHQPRQGFLARHGDAAVLADSTSGGFFTAMAEWTFQQGGVVCAATYDDAFRVLHAFAEQGDDLHRFRGSKYVQSDLNDCFPRTKALLEAGRVVTFVGTPCQVYGLKAFLGKAYAGLYTVDLVCHGVPSPKLWDAYLQYQQTKHRARVCDVSFRSKAYGYHSSTMKLVFENGREYKQGGKVDVFLRSFYADAASRPSCYACPYKVLERCSDFTIYDAWHAHQLLNEPRQDDDRGYTNIIVHTQRAARIMDQLPSLCFSQVDVEQAIALDGAMVRRSATPHPTRKIFYQHLSAATIARQVQACIPVSRAAVLLRQARPALHHLGLLGLVRKLKRALKP